MHPVEDAQERRLAAARWADERCHLARLHVQRHAVEHLVIAEPGRDVPGIDARQRIERRQLSDRAHGLTAAPPEPLAFRGPCGRARGRLLAGETGRSGRWSGLRDRSPLYDHRRLTEQQQRRCSRLDRSGHSGGCRCWRRGPSQRHLRRHVGHRHRSGGRRCRCRCRCRRCCRRGRDRHRWRSRHRLARGGRGRRRRASIAGAPRIEQWLAWCRCLSHYPYVRQVGDRSAEGVCVGHRHGHTEVGDVGHDQDRPWFLTTVHHQLEVLGVPRPLDVSVDRDDAPVGHHHLRRMHVDDDRIG